MLVLIIAVATFNILSALVMVVTDKEGEVAILRTMGMSESGIVKIFMVLGASSGVIGALFGAGGLAPALASILCSMPLGSTSIWRRGQRSAGHRRAGPGHDHFAGRRAAQLQCHPLPGLPRASGQTGGGAAL